MCVCVKVEARKLLIYWQHGSAVQQQKKISSSIFSRVFICEKFITVHLFCRTITNVEEHIKNTLVSETASTDSTYRNLKIDIDSIEIKRQLDPDVLQKAAFIHEQVRRRRQYSLIYKFRA
jgi:hypothetical protein